MRKHIKRISFALAIIAALTLVVPLYTEAALVGEKEISSQAAIVMDVETGVVLYSHNADAQRVPASITKLMSAYVVYDAIRAGETKLDAAVKISKSVAEFSRDWEYSNVPLSESTTVTVSKLLEVVLIRSACAATVALAEHISGSEDAFVRRMNQKASSLGFEAKFHDSYGGSPDNRVSARGLAILSRALIREFPEILNITKKSSVSFNGQTYNSSNLLLGDYAGLDGLKTGYTVPAGYCFVGTALRNGRRLIAVTLGSTLSSRYPDTRVLLDYGFSVADRMIAEQQNSSKMTAPSSANLVVNGTATPLTAYLIDELHYFKLRDIAFLLNSTSVQFEVTWSDALKTAYITSGEPYTAIGGELSAAAAGSRPYAPTTSSIYFNGAERAFEVYLIDNSNYFKLRDLAELLEFEVGWVPATRTVTINTQDGSGSTGGSGGTQPDGFDLGSLASFFFDVVTDIIASDLFMDTSIEMLAFDMIELTPLSEAEQNVLMRSIHDVYGFETIGASIDELYVLGYLGSGNNIQFQKGLLITFTNVEIISNDEFVFSVSIWRGSRSTNIFIDYKAERQGGGAWGFTGDLEFAA